jgi:hypothetical protein
MTIAAVPFTSLALVAHSSGGAILSNAGSYVAASYVPASVVGAFGSAAAALESIGTAAVGLATACPPLTIGLVVVTTAAVGTYCYLNGVPAPVAETLVHAGLATPSEKGLAILIPKLAAALVLLGAAGYVAYRFYENFKDLWADREGLTTANESAAQEEAERNFGGEVWSTLGKAVWATKAEIAEGLANVAQQALDGVASAADVVTAGASTAYETAASGGAQVAGKGKSLLNAFQTWVAELRLSRP